MDRRSFMRGLGLLVGGVVAAEAIPLGRVWSFPRNIVIPQPKGIPIDIFNGQHIVNAWLNVRYDYFAYESGPMHFIDRHEVLGG